MGSAVPAPSRRQPLAAALGQWPAWTAAAVLGAVAAGLARQAAYGAIALPAERSVWLFLHLAAVLPAIPIGAYVLVGRKGTRLHRRLGRIWAGLMMAGALSSFGLHSLMGHLSPIHLLSALTLLAVPYGVRSAMRGDIARHRRTMTRVYVGLIGAGLFAFVPGRLLGLWLFG